MSGVGLIGMAGGAALLCMPPPSRAIAAYLAPIAVMTSSYALFQTANNTAIMKDVLADQRGVISGLLSLSRNLGLITGASLMGAVFATASASTDMTAARPEAVAAGMRTTFAVAALLILAAIAIAVIGRALARRAAAPVGA